MIKIGLPNFKIIQKLEEEKIESSLIPTNSQISDRRYYLKNIILGELKKNTKGGFLNWYEENNSKFQDCGDHELIIVNYLLEKDNFILLITTKGLLKNAINQSNITRKAFIAIDATHKIVSCRFRFSTFATCTLNQEIADIAYMVHSSEDTDSYEYGLKELKKFLRENFNFEWDPEVNKYVLNG